MKSESAAVFEKIYEEHQWGGTSRSGPGSDPHVLTDYGRILTSVVAGHDIHSVVDVGCGDWAFSRNFDWSRVDYTGVDIVEPLIARLNNEFGSPRKRFVCADLAHDELPAADLCVIKDVLQHSSNLTVHRFLQRLPQLFKYALITNDITHEMRASWRKMWRRSGLAPNIDIPGGGYRPLRLLDAPFALRAERLALLPMKFTRWVGGGKVTVRETKEVLLWRRDSRDDGQRDL